MPEEFAADGVSMSRRRLGALAGYALSVGLTAAVTLVSIPILIAAAGAHAWASIALAQAVGTAGAILVGFGWGITGPTVVASTGQAERLDYFVSSFWSRVTLAVPALAITAAVTFVSTSTASGASTLNAIAYTLTGLLSGWFFTGSSRPWSFFLLDAIPRIAGASVGTAAVFFGAPLWVFGAAQIVGILLGVAVTVSRIAGKKVRHAPRPRAVAMTLRSQSHGMLLSSVSAIVTGLPPVLVSLLAPAALPAYSLADKLMRFATTGFSPVLQFLQGWVPAAIGTARIRRANRAACSGAVMAIVAGIAFALLAPLIGDLLSRDSVQLDGWTAAAFGLVLAALIGAQVVGLVGLLALDATRQFARYTLVGAFVGMPLTALGALFGGAPGAAFGFAIGELLALTLEVTLFWQIARGPERYGSARSDPDPAV
ncbi:hypothetical protein ACIPJ2_06595 [Curtobacterium sp. NPDC090217]|uniref:hypothetical protein n=1 Tax=Curtobacterium sp. NPDC090217 TaxID=3363970 RepID=UPI00381D782D